ncbi:MAG: TauD/TfdA family dioxygenase [Acidimicrobiales bacterium]|nr:TauD/TfdA family dioxygenase [Acidimicrobiales bacterium]
MTTLHPHLPATAPSAHPTHSGLVALVDAVAPGTVIAVDALPERLQPGAVPLVVLTGAELPGSPSDELVRHLRAGGRAVLAVAPPAAPWAGHRLGLWPLAAPGARPVALPAADDPLVFDPSVTARVVLPELDGLRLAGDDLVALAGGTGRALAEVEGRAVALVVPVGAGTLVVLGGVRLLTNRWIAAADNAAVLSWALTGHPHPAAPDVVRAHRPDPARHHAPVPVVDAHGDTSLLALLPPADVAVAAPEFMAAAARAARLLPPEVHDALVGFVDRGEPAGALLLTGMPVGDVPPTPPSPTASTGKDHVSELSLLTVGRRLGQPVGYEPEHGGDVVQNLLPTASDVDRQTSTSSGVELEFHTETAFHRHRPRYLLLICLRGDPAAATTLCSVSEVLDHLPLGVQQVLREPRFRTGVDESFTGRRSDRLGRPMPVLSGSEDRPTFVFDADLMVGIDQEAEDALQELRAVIGRQHVSVTLAAGDLLVVDNAVAVHGRSPFAARFDGTDRWLQRAFVVADLAPSAGERVGRVLTTRFAP